MTVKNTKPCCPKYLSAEVSGSWAESGSWGWCWVPSMSSPSDHASCVGWAGLSTLPATNLKTKCALRIATCLSTCTWPLKKKVLQNFILTLSLSSSTMTTRGEVNSVPSPATTATARDSTTLTSKESELSASSLGWDKMQGPMCHRRACVQTP